MCAFPQIRPTRTHEEPEKLRISEAPRLQNRRYLELGWLGYPGFFEGSEYRSSSGEALDEVWSAVLGEPCARKNKQVNQIQRLTCGNVWWAMTDSNCRPCACKAPALATAPIAQNSTAESLPHVGATRNTGRQKLARAARRTPAPADPPAASPAAQRPRHRTTRTAVEDAPAYPPPASSARADWKAAPGQR